MTQQYDTYILAFGPHPDDVDVGCGGLLYKTVQEGKKNVIIDLSPSQMSTRGNPELRQQEAQNAAGILGVLERINLKFDDLQMIDDHMTRLIIAQQIRKYRPEIVLFPYHVDRHPDHEVVGVLVKNAIFCAGIQKINLDSLTPHRPRLCLQYMIWEKFEPDIVIPITEEQHQTKMKAIHAFESQYETNEWGFRYFESRAVELGRHIGAHYGEGYKLHQSKLGLDSLDHLLVRPF